MPNIEGTPDRCKVWVIPLPNVGDPKERLSADEIEKHLNLKGKKRCDCMGHYEDCSWILVEKKNIGNAKEALKQLEETLNAAKSNKYNVRYILLIYSGKAGRTGQVYQPRKSNDSPTGKVLYNVRSTRSSPAEINNIIVWAIDGRELDEYRNKSKLDNYY